MKPIFKDEAIQKSYDKDGYVKFPFLNLDLCTQLISAYEELKPSLSFYNGLHITAEMASPETKNEVKRALMNVIEESIQNTFQNHRCIMGSFLMKEANTLQSKIGVHQDWTFVPEDEGFSSGTLWIALEDIPKERGAIGFVRGSHKWSDHFRYSPIESAFNPFYQHTDLFMENLWFEEMKAGEAILWDNRVLHGSVGNTTEKDRMVAGLSILPEDAPLHFHYQMPKESGKVGVFEVDEAFYIDHRSGDFNEHFSKGMIPNGMTPLRTYPVTDLEFDSNKLAAALRRDNYQNVTADDLIAEKQTSDISKEAGLIERIRSFFSS